MYQILLILFPIADLVQLYILLIGNNSQSRAKRLGIGMVISMALMLMLKMTSDRVEIQEQLGVLVTALILGFVPIFFLAWTELISSNLLRGNGKFSSQIVLVLAINFFIHLRFLLAYLELWEFGMYDYLLTL